MSAIATAAPSPARSYCGACQVPVSPSAWSYHAKTARHMAAVLEFAVTHPHLVEHVRPVLEGVLAGAHQEKA